MFQRRTIGPIARDVPYPFPEERLRIFVGFGLHVFRQPDGHGAGLSRVGQYPHGLGQRRQQLIRPVDAVPVAANRFEAVVDRHILAVFRLELLEDRRDIATGEEVTRQQQNGNPVDGRRRCARDHVRCAGPDRRRAGEGLQPVPHLGIADSDVNLRLLITRLVVAEVRHLLERLADPRDVAVSEDTEAAGKEGVF